MVTKRRSKTSSEDINLQSGIENDSVEKTNDAKKTMNKNKFKENGNPLGAMPFLRNQRYWVRFVVVLCVITFIYFSPKNKERKLALFKEKIPYRLQKFDCSNMLLNEMEGLSKGCIPKNCGRFVSDSLVTIKENDNFLELSKKIFKVERSRGIEVYDLKNGIFTNEELLTFKIVKAKIQHAIADTFQIDESSIYLTHPTTITKFTNESVSAHELEIFRPHIDVIKYKAFHYTSLVYLNDFSRDFTGGRLIFTDGIDRNKTISSVEPKKGRVLIFTSGSENLHNDEKVEKGTRLVLMISFTCNENYAVEDPEIKVK